MSYTPQQKWNPQGVVTAHAAVPTWQDAMSAYSIEIGTHAAPPPGINREDMLGVLHTTNVNATTWNPRPGSIVFAPCYETGTPLLNHSTIDTALPAVVSSFAGIGRHLRWRIYGVATSELTAGDHDYTNRAMAVQIAGSTNLTNTGPHAIEVGDTLVAMFPEVDAETGIMKYGERINDNWDGRYVPEIWPLRELLHTYVEAARADVRLRVLNVGAGPAPAAAPPAMVNTAPIKRLSELMYQLPYVASHAWMTVVHNEALRVGNAFSDIIVDLTTAAGAVQGFVRACVDSTVAGQVIPEASCIAIDEIVADYTDRFAADLALGAAVRANATALPAPNAMGAAAVHYTNNAVILWTEFVVDVTRGVQLALSRAAGSHTVGKALNVAAKGGNIHTVLTLRSPEPSIFLDA